MYTKILEATTQKELNRWVVAHLYVVVSYVVSLRGLEGFLLELEDMTHFWNDKRTDKKLENVYTSVREENLKKNMKLGIISYLV